MRRSIAVFLLATAIACTSGRDTVSTAQDQDAGTTQTGPVDPSTTVAIPDITPEVAAQLRARAFVIGCRYIACEDSPIYASERIPDRVRAHIKELLTRDVSYLTDQQEIERGDPQGGYSDGGAWIGVDEVEGTDRADVVSVMTWVYGPGRNNGTQTLFQWNGAEWVNVSAEDVGVTVVSAVP
jgi:hypothetical protein